MSKHENFNDWYAEWTGSDTKCENLDVIGAWEYQQKRIQYLEKAYTNLKLQLENKEIDAGIDEKKIKDLKKENLQLQIYMLEVQQNLEDVEQLKKEKSLYEVEVNHIATANQQWQLKCAELEEKIRKVQQSIDHSLWWVEKHKDGDVYHLVGGVVTSYQLIKMTLEDKGG